MAGDKEKYQLLMSKLIQVTRTNSGPNVIKAAADMCQKLAKQSSSHAMTPGQEMQMLRELSHHSPDHSKLMQKYEKLKAAGVPGLDAYLQVVTKIMSDSEVVKLVSERRSKLEESASAALARSMSHKSASTVTSVSSPTRRRANPSEVNNAAEAASPSDSAHVGKSSVIDMEADLPSGSARSTAGASGVLERAASASLHGQEPEKAECASNSSLVQGVERLKLDHHSLGSSRLPYLVSDHVDDRSTLIEGISYPAAVRWNEDRPYLTGQHLWQGCDPLKHVSKDAQTFTEGDSSSSGAALGSLDVAVQELLVLQDLLFAMVGIEGKYIQAKRVKGKENCVTFRLNSTMDISLQELARRMLPLCESFYLIDQFAETRSHVRHGLVCHAVAATLREFLQDYNLMVAQLEHQFRLGRLSLHSLWFYSQPMISAFNVLATLVRRATAEQCYGASLLNVLQTQAASMAGDTAARALLQRLVTAASVPYFNMLERWIYEGVIDDPYCEFLVKEDKELEKELAGEECNSMYWQKRYVLRPVVPVFLAEAKDVILVTGKYLNAIRECGVVVAKKPPPGSASGASRLWAEGGYLLEAVRSAHEAASQELLGLIFRKFDLMGRLRSLKHYFLVDQGDFLLHFADIATDELSKPHHNISTVKLQSLLELALRTSVSASDPYHEDLLCKLEPVPVLEQMYRNMGAHEEGEDEGRGDGAATAGTSRALELERPWPPTTSVAAAESAGTATATGLDAFSLDYKVGWPLSLVISYEALHKYQLIFRHLFQCKHVERQLCISWQGHQATRGLGLMGTALQRSNFLCQRMIHFMQNLLHYMTFEVLEPQWHVMNGKLQTAKAVDEVIRLHLDFLRSCARECLLESPKLMKKIDRMKRVCLQYTRVAKVQLDHFHALMSAGESALRSGKGGLLSEGSSNGERRHTQQLRSRQHIQGRALAEAGRVVNSPEFQSAVGGLEASFHEDLQGLVSLLQICSQTEPYLAHLAQRLA